MSLHGDWYVKQPSGTVGPVSVAAVTAAIDAAQIRRGDLVRHGLDEEWQPIELSYFGTHLPPAHLPARSSPLRVSLPTLAAYALFGFMTWSIVDLLLYMKSTKLTAWVVGIFGFLALYVAGLRAKAKR